MPLAFNDDDLSWYERINTKAMFFISDNISIVVSILVDYEACFDDDSALILYVGLGSEGWLLVWGDN